MMLDCREQPLEPSIDGGVDLDEAGRLPEPGLLVTDKPMRVELDSFRHLGERLLSLDIRNHLSVPDTAECGRRGWHTMRQERADFVHQPCRYLRFGTLVDAGVERISRQGEPDQ